MKFIAIVFLLVIIILAYIFLFWVLKRFSSIIIEYDNEDTKNKREIFFAFLLYSGFIIIPCYFIFASVCKLIEFFYS